MNSETHHSHFPPSVMRVCVDQAKDGRISGKVYSMRMAAPLVFSDFGRLLLWLDAFMDMQNYPQSFQRKRLFPGCRSVTIPASIMEPPTLSAEQVLASHGNLTTFDLQVYARQNATWQGRILFQEEGEAALLPFQSTLDLIHLVIQRVPC